MNSAAAVRAPAALPPSLIAPLFAVLLDAGAPLVPAELPVPEGVVADPLPEAPPVVVLPPLASAAAWNIAKVFVAGALTEKTIPF